MLELMLALNYRVLVFIHCRVGCAKRAELSAFDLEYLRALFFNVCWPNYTFTDQTCDEIEGDERERDIGKAVHYFFRKHSLCKSIFEMRSMYFHLRETCLST